MSLILEYSMIDADIWQRKGFGLKFYILWTLSMLLRSSGEAVWARFDHVHTRCDKTKKRAAWFILEVFATGSIQGYNLR